MPVPVPPKRLTLDEARRARESLRKSGQRLVVTNGVFDLLHAGHLAFLRDAAALGDVLWVLINSDTSVRALKGPRRPVLGEDERAFALDSLACVDGVLVFPGERLPDELTTIAPDEYAKAGDYTLETLDPGERAALEKVGAAIHFLPLLEGYSTTRLIERIAQAYPTPAER